MQSFKDLKAFLLSMQDEELCCGTRFGMKVITRKSGTILFKLDLIRNKLVNGMYATGYERYIHWCGKKSIGRRGSCPALSCPDLS
jgi:hypothetical protein